MGFVFLIFCESYLLQSKKLRKNRAMGIAQWYSTCLMLGFGNEMSPQDSCLEGLVPS
jgi:hypothetical protein